jgi:uncharacterized protein YraI
MNRILMAAAALAFTLGVASSAAARPGFATTAVNLRAGPSTGFPVVTTIPGGAAVDIHGCEAGYVWCDVGWGGTRGWVAGRYLQFVYNDRRVLLPSFAATVGLPIIGFSVGSYWDNYYRDRSWYRRRAYWSGRYDHRHYRGARVNRRGDVNRRGNYVHGHVNVPRHVNRGRTMLPSTPAGEARHIERHMRRELRRANHSGGSSGERVFHPKARPTGG